MTRPVRVLQSFPEPGPMSNPYIVMLRDELDEGPDVAVATFTWRRALLGHYDVFHAHWPEILVAGRGRSRAQALARKVLFLLLLLKVRLTGVALVRTAHNLRPHETQSRTARLLLALADRWTTLVIRLNEHTSVPLGPGVETVPHGHYRDWFAAYPGGVAEPNRVAFVGLIRPYKNVEELIRVFRQVAEEQPELSLVVAGKPVDEELADRVRTAAGGHPLIFLELAHLPDGDLVEVVQQAALVVLPYREMHNSGAALMALSLDRPVLVPANDVTAGLAAEVGAEWVLRYDGTLTGERLLEALGQANTILPGARPDLRRREWAGVAAAHLAAYRQALDLRRRGRHGSSAGE